MSSKKNYSRFFIILQEDDKHHGISQGKTPTGYAKIEVRSSKCRISYYVQNLKLDEKYFMVIICGKNGEHKLINIGNMVLDEQGRIDTSYEYDINNIAGTSISYDKIVGAAVVKKNQRNIVSILSGFMTCNIPRNWEEYELIEAKDSNYEENIFEEYEKSIEESKIEKNRVQEQKVDQDNELDYKDVEVEVNKQDVNNNVADDKEVVSQDTNLNNEVDEKLKDEDINSKQNQNVEFVKESEADKVECHKYRSKKTNPSEKFFMSLVEDSQEVDDPVYNVKNCRWFKINVLNFDDLCDMSNYDKYVVINYPMMAYYEYIKKYGYFLIGYKYDKNNNIKYIIYAIPGEKLLKCQPYQGRTGFVTWLKCKNNKVPNGYWVMFYDYKICKVLIPIKKDKKCYEKNNK